VYIHQKDCFKAMLSSPEPVAEPENDQIIQPHAEGTENDGNLRKSRDYVRDDLYVITMVVPHSNPA